MDIDIIIKDIKKELRANMNGIASKYMRENGLSYHINFGVELPRLLDIAKEFKPNHQVAQQLWNENVRESKILATMLMPLDNYYRDIANIWVDEIPNAEIAQQAVLHLFARLPYACDLAFEWIASPIEMRQLCGWLIVNRLLIDGAMFNERALAELRDQAEVALVSSNLAIRKAVMNAQNRLEAE